MKIGVDISQVAYRGTGVGNFTARLIERLITIDSENHYILFFSSLRNAFHLSLLNMSHLPKNVTIKTYPFPPTFLDILWNKLHVFPVEWLIGNVDVFLSSDWTQPPTNAKKATILYDLIVYKYPDETHNQWKFSFKNFLIKPNIVALQKRRLKWIVKEVDEVICISKSTKNDAMKILKIPEEKLVVIYPGI